MSMFTSILDRVFPHEDLPFGRRWRIAGKHMNPWTVTDGKVLKKPLPWIGSSALMLHRMVRADADRDLHDHPWWFLSLPLWGGYCEYTWKRVNDIPKLIPVWVRPWRPVFRHAEYLHRVAYLPRGECWTAVITGPRERKWGFKVGAFWVPHDTYRKMHPNGKKEAM